MNDYNKWDSLEFSILLAEAVQIDAAPEAGALAPDDYHVAAGDDEVHGGTCTAVDAVLHGLADAVLLAAVLLETDERSTHQTDGRLSRHRVAVAALSPVVVLHK